MAEHVQNLLSAYIDDELDERDRKQVESHLRNCPRCLQEFEELRTLQQQLYTVYESVEAPDEFEISVMEKIEGQRLDSSHNRENQLVKWAIAIFAASLMIVVFIYMAPLIYLGLTLASTSVTIGFHLLHTVSQIVSSIPYLLGTLLVGAAILIVLSLWSLHKILESQDHFVRGGME
ncbi:MAG TPA: zf-HC2 domain-containing protein [Bacillales bacterium]